MRITAKVGIFTVDWVFREGRGEIPQAEWEPYVPIGLPGSMDSVSKEEWGEYVKARREVHQAYVNEKGKSLLMVDMDGSMENIEPEGE